MAEKPYKNSEVSKAFKPSANLSPRPTATQIDDENLHTERQLTEKLKGKVRDPEVTAISFWQ